MKLKPLAGIVCLAQAVQVGLGLFSAITSHYHFSADYFIQLVLSIPLVVFFYHVWRKQKS